MRLSIVFAMENERNRRVRSKAPPISGGQARGAGPTPREKPSGFAFGPANYGLFAAALASILAGYLLLDRGSITAAPILLVVGYIFLIPAAFLVGPGRKRHRNSPSGEG